MNEATMVRRGFVPSGPSGAAFEALSRVADPAGSPVTVNLLLPGGISFLGEWGAALYWRTGMCTWRL